MNRTVNEVKLASESFGLAKPHLLFKTGKLTRMENYRSEFTESEGKFRKLC